MQPNKKDFPMSGLTNLIYEYGLVAMFLIILLEYACFPVSSEIVLPFSGAVASLQGIPFLIILPVSVAAGLIGTSLCYSIGKYGGIHILNGIARKFPKAKKGIDSSYEKFDRFGTMAVCFLRVIPLCRTYIAFIAGAVKQKYLSFLLSSLIGITVWNTLLIGIGYFLRENWKLAGTYYEEYKLILFPIILLVLLIVWLHIRKKKKKEIT